MDPFGKVDGFEISKFSNSPGVAVGENDVEINERAAGGN